MCAKNLKLCSGHKMVKSFCSPCLILSLHSVYFWFNPLHCTSWLSFKADPYCAWPLHVQVTQNQLIIWTECQKPCLKSASAPYTYQHTAEHSAYQPVSCKYAAHVIFHSRRLKFLTPSLSFLVHFLAKLFFFLHKYISPLVVPRAPCAFLPIPWLLALTINLSWHIWLPLASMMFGQISRNLTQVFLPHPW